MSSAAGTNMSNKVQVLFDLFQISHALTPSKNFGCLFNLSCANLLHEAKTNPSKFSFCDRTKRLTFKYQIPEITTKILDPEASNKKLSLSGLTAIVDIFTTWGLVQHPISQIQGRRFGVSLQLDTDLYSSGLQEEGLNAGDHIDVEVGVSKVGRIMGFTTAEIRNSETGQVICTGRHTKYMPADKITELALGRFLPLTKILSSFLLMPSTLRLSNASKKLTTGSKKEQNMRSLKKEKILVWKDIDANFSQATFLVESLHLNEGGKLHGGVSVMLMERIGNQYLAKNHSKFNWCLKSLNTSYLSSADISALLYVEVAEFNEVKELSECITTIKIKRKKSEKYVTVTEGILKWSNLINNAHIVSKY